MCLHWHHHTRWHGKLIHMLANTKVGMVKNYDEAVAPSVLDCIYARARVNMSLSYRLEPEPFVFCPYPSWSPSVEQSKLRVQRAHLELPFNGQPLDQVWIRLAEEPIKGFLDQWGLSGGLFRSFDGPIFMASSARTLHSFISTIQPALHERCG